MSDLIGENNGFFSSFDCVDCAWGQRAAPCSFDICLPSLPSPAARCHNAKVAISSYFSLFCLEPFLYHSYSPVGRCQNAKVEKSILLTLSIW